MRVVMALLVITLLLASPTLALLPEQSNGCGLGKLPVVKWGTQQLRHGPPPMVAGDFDRDGKLEGRSDSPAMARHDRCVENKNN